jgi:hypothetical protein
MNKIRGLENAILTANHLSEATTQDKRTTDLRGVLFSFDVIDPLAISADVLGCERIARREPQIILSGEGSQMRAKNVASKHHV